MTGGYSGLVSQDKEDVARSGNSTKKQSRKACGRTGQVGDKLDYFFQRWQRTARNTLVKGLSERLYFQFQSKRKMANHTIKAPSAHSTARKTCLSHFLLSWILDPSKLRLNTDPSAQTKKHLAWLAGLKCQMAAMSRETA